jgi:DNA-binding transcriptional LysR family regulator
LLVFASPTKRCSILAVTAEGKLFLEEARKILEQADEAVAKTRALARGEFGELHISYASSPTTELLPPALATFQHSVPHVSVSLTAANRACEFFSAALSRHP